MKLPRSKQGMMNLWILETTFLVAALFQISSCQTNFQITNVTSTSSTQLLVTWTSTTSQVAYFTLDLRVVNNASIAPITALVSSSMRSKSVQGLRVGTYYNITLKANAASGAVISTTWMQSQTLAATPVITSSSGINSSAVTVAWPSQTGVDYYFLMLTLGTETINRTVRALNCSIDGLLPSSLYTLTLYALNSAGPSAASRRVTVLTLTPPPMVITVTPLTSYSVTLTWITVEKALMYGIFIYEEGPNEMLTFIRKTTSSTITLDTLQPCTKYIFGLTSYNWFYTSGEERRVFQETGKLDPPQNLTISYSSDVESALITWRPSVGAFLYLASAKSLQDHEVTCSTSSTSCEIRGLLCEQRYVISVTAQTVSCSSNTSELLTLETAPCAPVNVTVIRDCHINTISLYWNPVTDAIKYTAVATAPNERKVECTNRDPNCFFMNLLCGTEYVMSVSAFNGKINGSSSPGVIIRTAPCDPTNVEAMSICRENAMDVSWNQSAGAISYEVSAWGSSGLFYNCLSVNTSCQITGLKCGESISVSVVAYDHDCPSGYSEQVDLITAPCAPEMISALTNCEFHTSHIHWQYSEGAVYYVARANSSSGQEFTCESFEQDCFLSDLPCGETYTVSVTASNYVCESPFGQTVTMKSAPCVPSNIVTELLCNHSSIAVKWTEGAGNLSFKAIAKESGAAEYFNCTTQGYECEITNINCGRMYTVSVEADNGQCVSSTSWTTPFNSVPCRPTRVATEAICANNSVVMSWLKSEGLGAEMFVATMSSSDGHHLTCQSTSEACVIQDTQCGQQYTTRVTAVSTNCQANSSDLHVDAVPCAPINLASHVTANVVVLSWMNMSGALNYSTEITGDNGEKHVCQTSNTTCSVTALTCGHKYNASVTAIGRQCSSKVSSTHRFEAAPCTPISVVTALDCVINFAKVTWNGSLGAANYTTTVSANDGEHRVCNTTDTHCDFGGLNCGKSYLVIVVASNGESSSDPSQPVELLMAPCVPQQKQPQIHCVNNSALVSWERTSGAVSYMANVTGPGEEALYCLSDTAECIISELKCGQIYNATVTAINAQCRSQPSARATIISVPCQPQNVIAQINCSIIEARMSWDKAPGALRYATTLKASGEDHLACNGTELNCVINGLQCGQTYNVSVTALNDECGSKASFPVQLHSVPCSPLNVDAQVSPNVVTLSWSNMPGTLTYNTEVVSGNGVEYLCHTSNTSCSTTDLLCGHQYNVTVTAMGQQCSSNVSNHLEFEAVPCTPQNVVTALDCISNDVAVSWSQCLGAESYSTSAAGDDGELFFCNSTDTHCTFHGLPCGRLFVLTVTATNGRSHSRQSLPINVQMAPCLPQDVSATVHCETNYATVSWSRTAGAENYTTLVTGPDAVEHTCNTQNTSCSFPDLHCGIKYNISVTALNYQCQGQSSSIIPLLTAPCAPVSVRAETDCMSGSVTLSWNQMDYVAQYTAYLMGSDDVNRTCNPTQANCVIHNLPCGQMYTLAVSAANSQCNGPLSNSVRVLTAPCIPLYVSTLLDCIDNSSLISWNQTRGAVNYTLTLNGPQGSKNRSCATQDTLCRMRDLPCGETFAVVVTAQNDICSSEENNLMALDTCPCVPQNVTILYTAGSNVITLQWVPSSGAAYYIGSMTSSKTESFICNSTSASCDITGIQCGETYNVSLTAFNFHLANVSLEQQIFYTAPCTPTNVRADLHCGSGTVSLLWDPAAGATVYSAVVTGPNGWNKMCSSHNTTCDISVLECGQMYIVELTALNARYSTVASPVEFHTAPCIPTNAAVFIDCSGNSINVTWSPSNGAESYTVTATGEDGHTHDCNTTSNECNIIDVHCGDTYLISVTAHNKVCSSDKLTVGNFNTAPCVPLRLSSSVSCESHAVTVSWDSARGADTYIVIAHDGQHQSSCVTSNTSCIYNDLLCDHTYQFKISSSSAGCNSTGNSSIQIKTIPCPPRILEAYATCENNTGIVQWEMSNNARSYMVGAKGHSDTLMCNTSDSSCELQNLECGQNYTVTIWAEDGTCRGPDSTQVTFKSVPCVPQNISPSVICGVNSLFTTWNASSGATAYFTTSVGRAGHVVTANTVDPTCLLPNLECGEVYSLTVLARNDECKSAETPALQVISAPCSPLHLTTTPQCPIRGASASWESSVGAKSYIATFTGMDGSTSNCSTTDTGCSVSGLNCGQVYNVSVTAYDNDCYSLTTNITQVSSAPCAPTNAEITIDCSGNSINVTWSPSNGAESYTVTATGTDGHTHDCNTTSNECNITDVHCGDTYLISVTAHNKDCSSDKLTVGNFNTVPCVADHVVVDIDCFTNEALVSWQENNIIQVSYTAVAHNLSGTEISCSTSSTSCHISGLECGLVYSFWVTAENQQCPSHRSLVYKTSTAPCQPQHLTEGIDCESNDGFLSWTESRGALYYTASMSGNGEILHCNNTNTNCTFHALQCGQSYNVSVVALDNKCRSHTSSTNILDTAPCQPQNLSSLLECSSQIAELSWGMSDGAHLYELTIHSAKEGMFSYNTSNNYFYELLYCGQNYSFNVMAIGLTCNSSSSQTLYQKSVPCFPQNPEVFMDCKNKSATYLWEASTEALSYLAMVHQDETIVYSCDTEATSCLVPNLNCGANYTFSVLARDLKCNSSFSSPVVSGVVPCPPDQVKTSIYHRTVKPQEVRISWNGSNCGEEYMASVQGELGSDPYSSFTLNSYWTSYMDFYIPVPCSSSYNVTVTARNSAGVSNPSHSLKGFTAPCTPRVNAQQVVNGNLLLSWDESVNTEEYQVFDLYDNHTVCKTSALSCDTSYTSNTLYLIAVNEAGESEPTIFAGASRK